MSASEQRILLVDDDTDLLRLLTIRLAAAGFRVRTAESGEKALGLLSIFSPHVVITDLRMNGIDGMALFDIIHQRHPILPVIILTAHGTIPDAVSATRRGVFTFLTKPFDGKVLLNQVERALEVSGRREGGGPPEPDLAWCEEIITRSPIMKELLGQTRLVAQSDMNIFVYGETGTGKELLARAIHKASPRRDGPFIAVNCNAIPEPLLESELFGHTRGAFTGASHDHKGLFQAAHRGILFLDEVGDMPMALQVKLLRALQEKQIRPIGSTQAIPLDVQVLSASHRNIEKEMEAGHFRQDLYYRLNVATLEVPPLSKRREDIPLLAMYHLSRLAERGRKKINGFSPEAMELLVSAPWPGNIRQLLNAVEQAAAFSTTPIIPASLVQRAIRDRSGEMLSLIQARNQFEREYLVQLLQIAKGNVSQAARMAKRNRTEFYKLLDRHRLDATLFRPSE